MKKIVVFGGKGGLGTKLVPLLKEKYEVISLCSKDVDVTNPKEVNDFFNKNHVDIVLNMSGKKYDVFLNSITEDDYKEIDDMLNVNIKGNINILSGCLPNMIKNKWGRVISISSIFSEMNVPKNSLYCASKAFLDRLISVANKENIKHGITCNTIQLGYWDGGMGDRVETKYQDMAKEKIGLKRFGKAQELYNTIDYIIENEYFCGCNLKINGGI
jgi:NADP-dependent 3-hydroxy acid dehydrogenase YdfG